MQPLTAQAILELFDTLGMRNTRPRRVLAERLASLAASGADFTTQDLWKEVQADDSRIGLATVYRAVDLLAREGLLDRLPFPDGTQRYRLCGVSHHHHVTCLQCQRVVEVDACLPAELLDRVASTTDFTIESHALELFGHCADCRARLPV
jgi:Fe2+ or Zn2+ uptake regulation protein